MKFATMLLLLLPAAFAADQKQLPNQAGNDDLDLQGTALTTPADIRQALGCNDLAGPNVNGNYMVVRIKVTPKSGKPVRVGPDDFTLLSRKNGERSPALTPHQVAGGGNVLVVRAAAEQPRGDGTTSGGTVWGGVTKRKTSGGADGEDSPIVPVLIEHELADKEIKTPVEGLLYFAMDAKLRPKDLSLIYNGAAGKLVIDFK